MSVLLGGELRDSLVEDFEVASKVTILTAYFTLPAAKLLLDNLPMSSQARLVVRARPEDLLTGATDIKAIRLLLDNGIPCHIHRTLHAKLYVVDDKYGWIGSSNFTSNGLKISGYGNIELSTKINISERDLKLIRTIISDSIYVTEKVLQCLEEFVSDPLVSSCHVDNGQWWHDILGLNNYSYQNGLLVADLPWCDPTKASNEEEAKKHDLDVFKFTSLSQPTIGFENTKVYQFIMQKMQSLSLDEVYFGTVTEWVHSALKDDIVPYRSEVKHYVSNLFSYLNLFCQNEIKVDRPRHSQRIKLLDND